ncbi:hypothetical protein [Gelria sp. Kuro-4]|uniref:hypothetical protein n=1 Tax=Gelria sp. Kuro-4 TaxID=2796927 RepID=UPI001BF00A3E|nr:hypothetical protein [Gelria sp. Kuro-4]BCV23920.1 hypothetical protein kuro4_06930 [Gelria sp. Kuro-4]
MLPSPKVRKHLTAIKKDRLSREELRELLKVIARDFDIPVEIGDEGSEGDFWHLSPEESQRFQDLLGRAAEDLKEKRYTEYSKPQV